MTVLVTGGKGFLGAALIRALVARDRDVICLDIKTTPGRLSDIADRVRFIGGGLSDVSSLMDVMKEHSVDRVAHMVYSTSHAGTSSIRDEVATMVMGTTDAMEAATRVGVDRFLFPSSIAYYGPQWLHGDVWLDESAPSLAVSIYGAGKNLSEAIAREYSASSPMNVFCLRLPAIYGPGARVGARGVNIGPVAAARGETAVLPYPADQRVCMAHILDVATAIARVLVGDRPAHPSYNIGGHVVSYGEIADAVRNAIPDATLEFAADGRSDLPYLIDDQLARNELQLRHRALAVGILDVIDETRRSVGLSPLASTDGRT